MTRYKNAFLGLIAVFLCSCGFGNLEQPSGLKGIQTIIQARSKEAPPPVDPRAVLTREAIDKAGIPLILVDIPSRQQSDYDTFAGIHKWGALDRCRRE